MNATVSTGWLALLALAVASCGGGATTSADVTEADETVSSGAEGGAEAVAVDDSVLPPRDPSRSGSVILDDPYIYLVRADLTQVRDTPLEAEVRRLFEAIPQWKPVLEATDLDPIQDIDALVAASPGRGSKEYIMLAKHNAGEERVRAVVEAMARDQGTELEWGEHRGVQAARWPGEAEVEQAVAIVRPGWIAVGPGPEVTRLLEIAKTGGGELIEGVPMSWTDATALTDGGAGLQATGRGLMGEEEQREHYPQRFEVLIENDEEGNVTCRWNGYFSDDATAEAARDYWDGRRAEYAGNPLLSVLGLSSIIENARFRALGAGGMQIQLELSLLQMSRLVRFATPILVGARRDRDEQASRPSSRL